MRPKLKSMFNYLVPLGLQSIVISLSVCLFTLLENRTAHRY